MSITFLDELGEQEEPPAGARSVETTPVRRPVSGTARRRLLSPRRWVWLGAVAGVLSVSALAVVPPLVRRSHTARCAGNFQRLGMAMQRFHDAHGHFPAAAITDKTGKPLLSWRVALLPQLGYPSLFQRFRLDEPWDSPHNRALLPLMPPVYACPSLADSRSFVTGYQVVVGPRPVLAQVGTLFEWSRGVEVREVLDGASTTVMVAETDRAVPWTQPEDLRFDADGPLPHFGSGHPGGFHAVFADGATRFLKFSISPETLRAILTRDGGEVSGG
jgi:hypothetical protein